jgi:hypothetical protein
MPLGCKFCIMTRGLRGSDIASLPQTEAELWDHIESEHHVAIQRPGETLDETRARFQAKYPEASDPKTCKCPDCTGKRRAASN